MQELITKSQSDSYIVNISGRQRMLSQRITKSGLIMASTKDSLEFFTEQLELSKDINLLNSAHRALQFGDSTINSEIHQNSAKVKALFKELEPHFQKINIGSKGLLSVESFSAQNDSTFETSLRFIRENEQDFLRLMNEITFQYDKEASKQINQASRTEYILYCFAIFLLLLERLFIFRPTVKKIKNFTKELLEKERIIATTEAKKQYIKELEDKNEELKTFSYITSHDLQEPLRTIIGFTEILSTNYKEVLDDKGIQMLNYVSESAKKSSDMIRDLLFYTKVGEKGSTVNVDCNQLIKEIKISHRQLIEDSHTTIQSSPLPVIQGFKTELKALFQNLISNAIKYRKPKVHQQIKINYVDNGDHHLFTFTDNGIGIDKIHHKEIFLIFKRVSEDTNHTGTGIGLAICKKIAQTHGGSIWVTSELNKGSVFHVSLPKTLPKEHQNATPSEPKAQIYPIN